MLFEREASQEKRRSRKLRRCSSLFSTLIFWRRFPMVPWRNTGTISVIRRTTWTKWLNPDTLTCWFIRSQDSLSWSHNPLSDVRELLLLLRWQGWELMSHPGGQTIIWQAFRHSSRRRSSPTQRAFHASGFLILRHLCKYLLRGLNFSLHSDQRSLLRTN